MTCPQCGAETTGPRCSFCGRDAGGGAGSPAPGTGLSQPTARDAEWQAAMGQPTARDPEWRSAVGQPTAADPNFRAAMGQPGAGYGATPGVAAPGGMQQAGAPLAKKGCCGCLSVVTLATLALAVAAALLSSAT